MRGDMRLVCVIYLGQLLGETVGIVAYDCHNMGANITTFSLTEIGRCKTPADNTITTTEKIQLLQLQDVEIVHLRQCKIHVTRIISHCGMHSHMSAVRSGVATYLHPVTRDMCDIMHQRLILPNFYGKTFDHLTMNGTTHATVLMSGRMTGESSCIGAEYEDHVGQWVDVIVQGALQIELWERHVMVRVEENKIYLPGGTSCPYQGRSCIDSIYGHSFWDLVDVSKCAQTRYTVIYEGLATKIVPQNITADTTDTVVYSVDKGEKIFAMPVKRPTIVCGQSAFETDHPKFYVVKPTESGLFYFTQNSQTLVEIDSVAYTNAKVVFVERHLRAQLTSLYQDVISQRCMLEQQVLRNLQTLAVVSPAEFAFAKTQVPGFTAINHGEVVHIIQCAPVEVSVRNTQRCYHELPILYDNLTVFMSPRSHIIQRYATEIECSPFIYAAYKLNGQWYKSARELHESIPPQILEPSNKNNWRYVNPTNLFAGGIYTQEDLIKLQKHLLLPNERQAVSGIIARGMTGLETDLQGTSFNRLLDEETIKQWITSTWGKIWGWFTTLGVITSGFMGIFIVGKTLKLIVDTWMHGLVLYDIFGFSARLIAALFDSVTMYFIHRHHNGRNYKKFGGNGAEQEHVEERRPNEEEKGVAGEKESGSQDGPQQPESTSPEMNISKEQPYQQVVLQLWNHVDSDY